MAIGLSISLPEGLEAFLIIAVVAAYFHHVGQKGANVAVIAPALLAVIVSIGAAVGGFIEVDSAWLQWLEFGSAAMGLITITWFINNIANRWAPATPDDRDGRLSWFGLVPVVFLGFAVVLRESVDAATFAAEMADSVSGTVLLPGIVIGLLLGVALAAFVYNVLRRLRAQSFQIVGSLILVLAGAALGAHAVSDLSRLGWMPSSLAKVIWDVNWIVPQNTLLGRFLHAFMGYNATPTGPAVIFYLSYLLIACITLFLLLNRAPQHPEVDEPLEETSHNT